MARRLKAMGQPKYQRDGDPRTSGPGFGITEHPDVLNRMLLRRKPARVFVNSMSDLFHPGVSDTFIARTWAVMALTPHVTYQVLTKRSPRLRTLLSNEAFQAKVNDIAYAMAWGEDPAVTGNTRKRASAGYATYPPSPEGDLSAVIPWPLPNVWGGVSVEDQNNARRAGDLLGAPLAVRFVSAEPLLGPVDLTRIPFPKWSINTRTDMVIDVLGHRYGVPGQWQAKAAGVDWVIVGCESGPKARPMDIAWVEQIVHDCQAAGVAVFVKQLPTGPRRASQDLSTFPSTLRVREYPRGTGAA
jgi:protein gp37